MTGSYEILVGDVFQRLRDLPDESVHCVVTSPPYYGLRDYGTAEWEGGDANCPHEFKREDSRLMLGSDGKPGKNCTSWTHRDGTPPRVCKCGARRVDKQLGLEPTPDEFIEKMVAVFREVRRVLRSDGVCWVNMGDSYCGGGRGGNPDDSAFRKQATNRGSLVAPTPVPENLKPKDLCGIPWRLALAMQADGWWLRSAMPWCKRSAMPESCTDRPASALEYIFLFTKSATYFFDNEAVKVASSGLSGGACIGKVELDAPNARRMSEDENGSIRGSTRNFRNTELWFESLSEPHGLVWCGDEMVGLDVNPFAYKAAHFATYPPNLVRPLVKAGTSEKGCCPQCGKPWVRETNIGYEKSPVHGAGSVVGRHDKSGANNWDGAGLPRLNKVVTTLGFRPDCECMVDIDRGYGQPPDQDAPDPVPCTVLDIFAGSCTTLMVACQLGRNAIGIELNPDYAEMGRRRVEKGLRPNTARTDDAGDAPLFAACDEEADE